jgi:hypothetical protein
MPARAAGLFGLTGTNGPPTPDGALAELSADSDDTEPPADDVSNGGCAALGRTNSILILSLYQ